MTSYKVDVLQDEAAPTSGAAVIRIGGLAIWPQGGTVRLKPIDESAVPPQSEGWPWGEIVPDRVIPTGDSVDVFIGPDVVSSPRLIPGTPVTIEVSAANVEADVRWPAIAPTQRRRVAAVAMSASQVLAAKVERERADREAAARRQQLAEAATRSVREAAEEARGTAHPTATTDQLARLSSDRRATAPARAVHAVAGGASKPLSVQEPRQTDDASRRPRFGKGSALWFFSGLLTMGLLGLGLVWAKPDLLQRMGAPSASSAAGPERLDLQALAAMLKDIGQTGNVSPKKKSALNVDIPTALSLADHSLRGQRTAADTDEAEFWLKRALGASFGGSDIGWGLTQLGTLYARTDAPHHSYAKAHTLWQLAAAQGDPVANCFLGALYEHGLGVPADRRLARTHYQAADAANACSSAKDAVARLKE